MKNANNVLNALIQKGLIDLNHYYSFSISRDGNIVLQGFYKSSLLKLVQATLSDYNPLTSISSSGFINLAFKINEVTINILLTD
jgi:hypothetical protein